MAVVCLIIVISDWFRSYSDDAFVEWAATLTGAIVGAILAAYVGVRLFYFQREVSDEERRRDLMAALAGEAQAIIDILSADPTPVPGVSADYTAKSIFVPLPLTVATEAARSALFDAHDLLFLSKLIAKLQVNNDEIGFMLANRSSTIPHEYRRHMDEWLKERQNSLIAESRTLIKHLEETEGITVPNATL